MFLSDFTQVQLLHSLVLGWHLSGSFGNNVFKRVERLLRVSVPDASALHSASSVSALPCVRTISSAICVVVRRLVKHSTQVLACVSNCTC